MDKWLLRDNRCLGVLLHLVTCVVISVVVLGCAVVSTTRTQIAAPNQSGVSYYLPRKDVVVTVTVPEKGKGSPTLAIASTPAYPDLGERFVARYSRSWIGTDKINIGVTSGGLLTSAKTEFTSELPTILKNIAKAAGMATAAVSAPESEKEQRACRGPGTYSEIFVIDKPEQRFESSEGDFSVSITRMGVEVDGQDEGGVPLCDKAEGLLNRCTDYNGFFYRQEEPYEVQVEGDSACGVPSVSAIVFSPTNSPLGLLKVERGLFANANTNFGFQDGALVSYEQSKDSEISALSALPADIASAYFSAIGSMFTLQSTNATNEASYEKALAALMLQQMKTKECLAALAAKDAAAIEASCK